MDTGRVRSMLWDIYDLLWEIDIPSPTVPEYVEHHEDVQKVMTFVRKLLDDLDQEDEDELV